MIHRIAVVHGLRAYVEAMRFVPHSGVSKVQGPRKTDFIHRTSAEANGEPIETGPRDWRNKTAAEHGSKELGERTNRAIAGYAMRKGINPYEAQWLLLDSGGCVN